MSFVAIRTGQLDSAEAVRAVSHAGAGAIDLFLGIVRENNDGRPVNKLEYEVYEAMAILEMRRVADELEAEMPGVRVAAIHRVGSLSVGEEAVVCAASAPHRGEAFLACKKLIDRIKSRVPIWKREHGPDGAYWVGWVDARCRDPSHGHLEGVQRKRPSRGG